MAKVTKKLWSMLRRKPEVGSSLPVLILVPKRFPLPGFYPTNHTLHPSAHPAPHENASIVLICLKSRNVDMLETVPRILHLFEEWTS